MKNKKFILGKLTLIEKLPVEKATSPKGKNKYKGRYQCFCGKEFITIINAVNIGKTRSCGCYRAYRISKEGKDGKPESQKARKSS